MTNDYSEELRARIGANRFEEIKAFLEKGKAEGRSADQLKSALRDKFGKELRSDDLKEMSVRIDIWFFVDKSKAEGKKPEEVAAAIRTRFGKELDVTTKDQAFVFIKH